MIKLVVSDLDGTLIGKDEVLPSEAIPLVQSLVSKGIYFTLATGRVEEMAALYAEQLGLKVPYVACNGATIVQGSTILQRLQIPALPLQAFINQADHLGMSIIYSIEGKESVWNATDYIKFQRLTFNRYHRMHQFTEQEWQSTYIDKLSIMSDHDDEAIAFLEKECHKLGTEFGYTRYMDRSIEIVHKEATKANGVKFIASHLNIPMEQILFVGDHQNDIDLLKVVGVGIAVNNSTDQVKACADYVCEFPQFRGVAEAVRKFVFGEES